MQQEQEQEKKKVKKKQYDMETHYHAFSGLIAAIGVVILIGMLVFFYFFGS